MTISNSKPQGFFAKLFSKSHPRPVAEVTKRSEETPEAWLPPEVTACSEDTPGARLMAVGNLFGVSAARLCLKKQAPAEYRALFSHCYSYGPGGSDRDGDYIAISMTSHAKIQERIENDRYYDQGRPPNYMRGPRFRSARNQFVWVTYVGRKRNFSSNEELV